MLAVFSGLAWPLAAADETLNNAAIVKLSGLDLGDAVVIEKIKTSACDFDTSIEALQQLKAAKVSNPVIAAMIATKKSVTTPAPVAAGSAPASGDPNDPAAPHAPGVWVLQEVDGQKKMLRLDAEAAAGTTSGGGAMWAMGWGATAQTRLYFSGPQATVQLAERKPTFYLYLGSGPAAGTLGLQSPKEATMAQFEVAKGQRGLITGSINAYAGARFGIEPRATRLFDSEMVAEGIY